MSDPALAQTSHSLQVWSEWRRITRFLESARLAFARERDLWSSLRLASPEEVRLSSPTTSQGTYEVTLDAHLRAVADEEALLASVLIHTYALTESAVCDRLTLDSRNTGGIESWGAAALKARGKDWTSVFGGKGGCVEVAVVRNAFAHGTRKIDVEARSEAFQFWWSRMGGRLIGDFELQGTANVQKPVEKPLAMLWIQRS